MLEPSSTLTYKAVVQIVREPQLSDSSSLLESILTYVASYIKNRFSLSMDNRFISGAPCKAEKDGCTLRTAILHPEEGTQEDLRWAAHIRARDPFNRRRTWTDHIGLERRTDDRYTLYFAEYCAVHQAGSLSSFKPPLAAPPTLLRELLHSPLFTCTDGSCRITDTPWIIIDEELDEFISLLYDRNRTVPIVIVTCPDMVSLKSLCAKTTGNLIICCLDDFKTYSSLCNRLPASLQFPWDAIKIFIPFSAEKTYHTTLPFQEIVDMGNEGVTEALYRAFCTCLTGDERRAFVNIESLYDVFKARGLASLREQNETLQQETMRLKKENERLTTEKKQLAGNLDTLTEKLHKSESTDYENLLNEALQETERLKRGLNILASRLYSNPKKLISIAGLEDCPEICDLAAALRTIQSVSGLQP